MKKVFSINTELYKVTGVQKVLMDIHKAVKDEYEAKIVGTISYDRVDINHNIEKSEYIRFVNPFMFYKSYVFIHERKLLLFFWILNTFFFQNIHIIYIHHSMLYGNKWASIMPKHVVGISESCIRNLVEYFKVPKENIHKIYNCVSDAGWKEHGLPNKEQIRLLCPARINSLKQQIEIVQNLKGKIDKRIKISFAGVGPLYDELKSEISTDQNFEALGFRDDVISLLRQYDYILLFSKQEGLPITLIEATMCGTPIICSNVGGNSEICRSDENGWVLEKWDDLIKCLNSLPDVSEEQYMKMSKKGREIYDEYFTFEEFKKKYLNLIEYI